MPRGKEYLFRGLRQPVSSHESLQAALERELGLSVDEVTVEREAIDARRKPTVYRVYNLRFRVAQPSPRLARLVQERRILLYERDEWVAPPPEIVIQQRPIIVGSGPAGLFAGLTLARRGHRPIILERGQPVPQRALAVERLWSSGELDPESNMQFGEGGAGTFSDGKLTTGKSAPLDRQILQDFVQAGAPEEIFVSAKPHIGTDRLRQVVMALRAEIESLGGELRFGARVDALETEGGTVTGVRVGQELLCSDAVVLAIGHSARDTVAMLQRAGVEIEAKPFAIGLRIEHPSVFIDETQYGSEAAALLPAADYKLTHHAHGTAVYSFCMCPGGQVVCSASEPGGQVTNGMSYQARDGEHSNSALVVGIDPARLGITSPLQAIAFQRQLERAAYDLGGGGYTAPAQMAGDFVKQARSVLLPASTYRPAVTSARLDELLPAFAARALADALQTFERRMPGFMTQGLLLGVETRTSSPLRMLRDAHCQCQALQGLYLLGEGSGYAGGIMTCARDGLRWAQRVKPRNKA